MIIQLPCPRPHSSIDLWSLSESRLWSSASLVTSVSFLSTPWALLSIHWRLSMCAFRIWIKKFSDGISDEVCLLTFPI